MRNLSQLLQQAQAMQAKMAELQERLAQTEISGSAGGGLVSVTVSGRGDPRRVKIDPSLAKPEEIEVLEDLIVAALADARAKQEQEMAAAMKDATGGIALPPGLKLF